MTIERKGCEGQHHVQLYCLVVLAATAMVSNWQQLQWLVTLAAIKVPPLDPTAVRGCIRSAQSLQ